MHARMHAHTHACTHAHTHTHTHTHLFLIRECCSLMGLHINHLLRPLGELRQTEVIVISEVANLKVTAIY